MSPGKFAVTLAIALVLIPVLVLAKSPPLGHKFTCLQTFYSDHIKDGKVNYSSLALKKKEFRECLSSFNIQENVYEGFSLDQKRAYWINAYNALVLFVVIDNYPIKAEDSLYSKFPENSPMSIKGAWTDIKMKSAIGKVTLSRIENNILPGLGEPLFIFAISNGTKGGAPLSDKVYTHENLSRQLEQVASRFLKKEENISVSPDGKTVIVSRYIKNHSILFEGRFLKKGQYLRRTNEEITLMNLMLHYCGENVASVIRGNKFQFEWKEIDWSLNDLLN